MRSNMTVWLVVLAAFWLLLAGMAPGSWIVGLPAVLLAAWAGSRLTTERRPPLSAGGLLRFVGYFLRESWRGGLDVARRVFARELRVTPGFVDYPLRLRDPAARRLFAGSVSLIPGTLAADLDHTGVRVHALDTGDDVVAELARLESLVADVFKGAA